MIETILNLVWLAVTLAVLWLWRFRWSGARRKPGHDVRLETVAMICILALLFPVISLTDDLHPEVVPVDAAASKRALCLLAAQHTQVGHAGAASNPHLALVFRSLPAHVELEFAGYAAHAPCPQPLLRGTAACGRAPPSLL